MDRIAWEAARRAGMPADRARAFATAFFEAIADAVAAEGSVHVQGFGVFEGRRRAPRRCRNPRTGAPTVVPAHNTIVFRPARALIGRVDEFCERSQPQDPPTLPED